MITSRQSWKKQFLEALPLPVRDPVITSTSKCLRHYEQKGHS
jgi:hypothetical protein